MPEPQSCSVFDSTPLKKGSRAKTEANLECKLPYSGQVIPVAALLSFANEKNLIARIESEFHAQVLVFDGDFSQASKHKQLKNWKPASDEHLKAMEYFRRHRAFERINERSGYGEFVPAHFYGHDEKLQDRPFASTPLFLFSTASKRRNVLHEISHALLYQKYDKGVTEERDGVKIETRTMLGVRRVELLDRLDAIRANPEQESQIKNLFAEASFLGIEAIRQFYGEEFDIYHFMISNAKALDLSSEDVTMMKFAMLETLQKLNHETLAFNRDLDISMPRAQFEKLNRKLSSINTIIENVSQFLERQPTGSN